MDALITGLLALAIIACLSWVWRRLRRIPEPNTLDRNLRAVLGDEERDR